MASHGSPARLAMSSIRMMLPLDSGATIYRGFNRVSPATASGHGSRRCHARFKSSSSAPGTPAGSMPNAGTIASRFFAMQDVEPRERASAAAYFFHGRRITLAPGVGECGRIDVAGAMPRQESCRLARHAAAPIDDSSKHVEHQRPDVVQCDPVRQLFLLRGPGIRSATIGVRKWHESYARLVSTR